MHPADSAFARIVHERVLNTLHLLMIRQANAELLRSTLEWMNDPYNQTARSPDRGLAEAVRDAVLRSGVARAKVSCPQGDDRPLSREVGEALSAAIVEALRNAQRHAKASELSVQASRGADWIHVEVRDDGLGFNAGAIPRLGLTLGITAAMASIAGTAQIRSDARQGTVVLLSLPAAPTQHRPDITDGHLIRDWPRIAGGAGRLFANLLAGRIQPQMPEVADQARIEDCRIRTWLDCNRVDSWMARQVAAAVEDAADHGRRVTATIAGQLGISAALDCDLTMALTDADAILLTVRPDHEELLVIVHGDTKPEYGLHPDLSWRVERVGEGIRGLRISRSR
jgi:hypothetical protein